MLVAYQPTLVIVDSAGEAMAVDGANPNYDDDVARWVRKFTKWIAVQGPGVLGLDHVVKDAGSRNLQPSGSHRKRDAITGAAYIVEMRPGSEFGIGRQGQARFTVSKDHAGHRVRGQVAGSFTLDATVRPYQVRLEPPEPHVGEGGGFRPTGRMEKASRIAEVNPGLTKNALATSMRGKKAYAFLAIEILVGEGYLEERPAPRRGSTYHSIRPYRESEDTNKEETP